MGLGALCVIAVLWGAVTGLGAVLFRELIGLIHNILFLGQFTDVYDANLQTPASPWGPWVILVPVLGGMGVVFLVTKFAPEARGHGVPEVSVRTFLPVALATGTATFVGRLFLGIRPAFEVLSFFLIDHPSSFALLLLYAVLGAVSGVAATGFIRGLHFAEERFEHVRNPYLRHAAGMTIVGLLIYGFFLTTGHYHVEGVGYATTPHSLVS